MGVADTVSVSCQLYKLLFYPVLQLSFCVFNLIVQRYETGGFFKIHRDSEKENGMFGTFVLLLPSWHEGGQLLVRHGGQDKVYDFGPHSAYNSHYVSSMIFCNCDHSEFIFKYFFEYVEDGVLCGLSARDQTSHKRLPLRPRLQPSIPIHPY